MIRIPIFLLLGVFAKTNVTAQFTMKAVCDAKGITTLYFNAGDSADKYDMVVLSGTSATKTKELKAVAFIPNSMNEYSMVVPSGNYIFFADFIMKDGSVVPVSASVKVPKGLDDTFYLCFDMSGRVVGMFRLDHIPSYISAVQTRMGTRFIDFWFYETPKDTKQ